MRIFQCGGYALLCAAPLEEGVSDAEMLLPLRAGSHSGSGTGIFCISGGTSGAGFLGG